MSSKSSAHIITTQERPSLLPHARAYQYSIRLTLCRQGSNDHISLLIVPIILTKTNNGPKWINLTAKPNKELPNFDVKDHASNVHVLHDYLARSSALFINLNTLQQAVEIKTIYNKGSIEVNKRDVGTSPLFGFRLFEIVNGEVPCELPRFIYAQIPRGTLEDTARKTNETVNSFGVVQHANESAEQYQERVYNQLAFCNAPDFNTYCYLVQQAIEKQSYQPILPMNNRSVLGKRTSDEAELDTPETKLFKSCDDVEFAIDSQAEEFLDEEDLQFINISQVQALANDACEILEMEDLPLLIDSVTDNNHVPDFEIAYVPQISNEATENALEELLNAKQITDGLLEYLSSM